MADASDAVGESLAGLLRQVIGQLVRNVADRSPEAGGGAAFMAHLDRIVRQELLVAMLGEVEEADAAAICVAFLDGRSAGMPMPDAFGAVREQAAFWAGIADPAEIEAYVAFGLREATQGRHRFALAARKRLLASLWETLPEADRKAFVRRVDPEGRFHRRAA